MRTVNNNDIMVEEIQMNAIQNYIKYGTIGLCTLGSIVPIVQVSYGAVYFHTGHECDSFITIPSWLIVNGVCTLLILFGIILSAMKFQIVTLTYNLSDICICVFTALFYLFSFAWIIVGTVMFFSDCYDVGPKCIHDLMFASLIIGYIEIISMMNKSKDK